MLDNASASLFVDASELNANNVASLLQLMEDPCSVWIHIPFDTHVELRNRVVANVVAINLHILDNDLG